MRCPYCNSERLVKAGKSKVPKRDYDRQRYLCKECRKHTVNPIKENE